LSEIQHVIDAFTEMAPHYEETVDRELRQFWGVSYDEFINRLLDKVDLAGAGLFLDVATGRAAIPRALMRRPTWQGRMVGLDITPEMVRGARSSLAEAGAGERVRLVSGSGMRLPFAAGCFDGAVCALATHHMSVPVLLSELRRVVRAGAPVLVADVATSPFWHSRTGSLWLRAMVAWYSFRHGSARLTAEIDALGNMMGPPEWRERLLQAGFVDPDLTLLPASKRWYPSGLLIAARASA
jgi:ubiquinone/menaquinone biosynthesis C-methylase UbiE